MFSSAYPFSDRPISDEQSSLLQRVGIDIRQAVKIGKIYFLKIPNNGNFLVTYNGRMQSLLYKGIEIINTFYKRDFWDEAAVSLIYEENIPQPVCSNTLAPNWHKILMPECDTTSAPENHAFPDSNNHGTSSKPLETGTTRIILDSTINAATTGFLYGSITTIVKRSSLSCGATQKQAKCAAWLASMGLVIFALSQGRTNMSTVLVPLVGSKLIGLGFQQYGAEKNTIRTAETAAGLLFSLAQNATPIGVMTWGVSLVASALGSSVVAHAFERIAPRNLNRAAG